MINPAFIAAGAFGVISVFGLGVKLGHEWGSTATENSFRQKAEIQAQINTKIINTKNNDLEQCRGQVAKINEVTAENEARIAALLSEDQASRREAQRQARARSQENQQRSERLVGLLVKLREDIDATELNPCMGDSVDPAYVGLLNAAIDEATGRNND